MATGKAVAIGDGNVLMFDDAHVQAKRGFAATLNLPARDVEPVVAPDKPWERGGIVGDSNVTVLEDGGLYRIRPTGCGTTTSPKPPPGRATPTSRSFAASRSACTSSARP